MGLLKGSILTVILSLVEQAKRWIKISIYVLLAIDKALLVSQKAMYCGPGVRRLY